MVTTGLLVRVEAKPDKISEVEAMLGAAVERVRDEGLAVVWFGLRLGPTTFAIFDAFTSETDRDTHLKNNAAALQAAAAELFTEPPSVEYVDIVAAKLPG